MESTKPLILFDENTDCWNWNGIINKYTGYGFLKIKRKNIYAHRYMYEKTGLKIPQDKEIDHLCRNPRCVNPDHLEAVTHRENVLRSPIALAAINSRKIICKYGHFLEQYGSSKQRYCRICSNKRQRDYRTRRRN